MIEQVIRASAGTGKTHTLLKTIFNYKDGTDTPTLSYKDACQNINDSVFVTFSNSAAAEIRSRIYKGLRECEGSPEPNLTQALAQQEVHPRVYTIHAFALEMLRLFRYKLCLPAEISFTEDDSPLWKQCVKEFFAKKWNQQALQELFIKPEKPEDKTEQALLEVFFLLSERGSLQEFLETKGNTLYFLAEMGRSSAFDLSANLAQAQNLLNGLGIDVNADYSEALLQARTALIAVKNKGFANKTKEKLEEELSDVQSNLKKKEEEQKELEEKQARKGLTEKQTQKLEKTKQDIEELKQKVEEAKQELDTFCSSFSLFLKILPVLDMCSYFVEKIVLEIGKNLYMPQMLTSGVFDFDAVVFLFINGLLRDDANFLNDLKAEGQAFHNLYVDEAQDNDIIQNYLIALLGKGKFEDVKVYVVGDLKQSIYTWRSAYPREFEQIIHECENYEGGRLLQNLDTSYRLQSQNTCEAINNVCTALSNKYGESWWYEPDKDKLKLPPKALNNPRDGKLEMWWAEKDGLSFDTTLLNSFFEEGKTAVVVRSRKQLTKVPDLQQKLQELKANYKMEINMGESEEEAKVNTLQPELELILLLFMMLTAEHVEQAPFALFWAEAGKLLTETLKLNPTGKISAELKRIFEKEYKDIVNGVGNRVECVLRLFDENNLWNYLCHKEAQETPQELRRIFYHILMQAQLAEERYNRRAHMLEADPVWTILCKGKMPRSCYSIPKDAAPSKSATTPRETKPAPDVLTIHGSKGLAYDNMIVVADFQEDFFGSTEDFNKSKEPYSQLFAADFEKILGDDLKLNISYFPYLGLLPAYCVKNHGAEISDLCGGKLTKNYQSTEKLIRSEKLNLLYVALTRTAKNLLLLDVGAHKTKKEKGKDDEEEIAQEPELDASLSLFEDAGFNVQQVDKGDGESNDDPTFVIYTRHGESFQPMDIKSPMQTHSVRSEIAGKIYRKYGKKLTCLERFEHAKKGSMAHAIIQRLLSQSATAEDFAKHAQTLRQHVAAGNGLYARAVKIVADNEQAIEKADLFGNNYTFFHEVPLWRFNEESKTLTKGSVDTLAVGDKEAVIVEYKVLFGDGHNQQAQAQEQMDRYEHILRELQQDYPVKTRAVELRE